MPQDHTRRLAAIWFADIAGYTTLSNRDEDAALAVVAELQTLSTRLVEAHGGRIAKFMGDAALATFASADAGIRAALELQVAFKASEIAIRHDTSLRIGVHIGEIVEAADGDVYGDGVNVASRIQSVAQDGTVVASAAAARQVENRPDFVMRSIGTHEFKGVKQPIEVFTVGGRSEATGGLTEPSAAGPAMTAESFATALSGRYKIERELGEGGMATVYLAVDLKHHRQVAVKVLKPDLAAAIGPERFKREIEIAANLTHPHILPLHDSGEAGGFLYYVMPYIKGESLRDRIDREKQLPIEDALEIATRVARALGHAHERGVIHRDIKPGNILMSDGEPLVADFGIAKATEASGQLGQTQTGMSLGTPKYMSPEQTGGSKDIDGRTDIYALGCVLYEMLAGQAPFTGPTPESIIVQHLTADVPSVRGIRPSVAPEVDAVIQRAMAKAPADRFRTATELVEALQTPRSPAGVSAVRGGRLARVAAIAVAVLAVGFGGRWAFNTFGVDTDKIEWVVVLPPENFTGEEVEDFFLAGMHAELISKLSQLPGLNVTSRTSAMQYVDTDLTLPQIAEELNVDAVIQSSVRWSGNEVRIGVQLIDAFPRERQIWSGTYTRPMENVLDLHSQVALAVAEQIQLTLTPEEELRLATTQVVDPAAYVDYLRGLYEYSKLNPPGWLAAIGHFQRSIAKDSTYAPAYAWMSISHSILGMYTPTPAVLLHGRALAAAERAVLLDSSLAEAHTSLSWVKAIYEWDWAAAERASQESVRLNPNSTMVLMGRAWLMTAVGRGDEAVGLMTRAVELEPVAAWLNTWLGAAYFFARRYDEAIDKLNEVLVLEPGYPDAHHWLSYALAQKGMYEEAASAMLDGSAIRTLIWSGRHDEARGLLTQSPAESVSPFTAYDQAGLLGGLGDIDGAFELLERAYEGRTARMILLKVDPRMDSLRDDPRFEDILRRINFPQ